MQEITFYNNTLFILTEKSCIEELILSGKQKMGRIDEINKCTNNVRFNALYINP
jgi:hypothetical protein